MLFERRFEKFGMTHVTKNICELPQAARSEKKRNSQSRNSAATILLTLGVHPKVVQELLGHSTIAMTMDTYSHLLPSVQKDAVYQAVDE